MGRPVFFYSLKIAVFRIQKYVNYVIMHKSLHMNQYIGSWLVSMHGEEEKNLRNWISVSIIHQICRSPNFLIIQTELPPDNLIF